MNKREFVLGSCAGLLVAGTAVEAAPSATSGGASLGERLGRPPELARDYSMAKWQHYLDHEFEVQAGATAQRLTLREIRGARSTSPVSEQFDLVFSGTMDQRLVGGTMTLKHGTGQQMAVFMQPAGSAADGQSLYSAHFNLLA